MIQILLIAVLSLLAQFVLPWLSLAIVAFVVCLWRSPSAERAFVYGFVGVAIVWFLYALLIHLRTDGIMTSRMSQLIAQTQQSSVMLLIAPLIGGIVGGFAGLSGNLVRQAIQNQAAVRRS